MPLEVVGTSVGTFVDIAVTAHDAVLAEATNTPVPAAHGRHRVGVEGAVQLSAPARRVVVRS
ncbi:MAG TPA: hypothetical protein VMS00_09990 [Acidimicrobiales bacterium]|nr:hypothetical protein [Acidimicrobiales bacterium]